jgi:hypothetical protein
MALTRSFKELKQRRVASDAEFGEALLREGIDTMLTGDVDTGKAILRDYIKATIGFEKLGEATGHAAEKPDPHVRAARQSPSAEPLQRNRLPAEAGRAAAACDGGARVNDRQVVYGSETAARAL